MLKPFIGVVIVALLCLAACSVERTEVNRIRSPDGRVTAVLMREAAGGAAGSSGYYVYLLDEAGGGKLKDATFAASRCDGISLTWAGSQTLRLSYPAGCAIKQFVNLWYSGAAIAAARAADVEIILVRGAT